MKIKKRGFIPKDAAVRARMIEEAIRAGKCTVYPPGASSCFREVAEPLRYVKVGQVVKYGKKHKVIV